MYKRILLAVDDDIAVDTIAAQAERMAGISGGSIKLLHVVQEPIESMNHAASARSLSGGVKKGESLFARIGERLRRDGIACEQQLSEVIGISVAQEIVRQADEWRAELVVMGTHGRRGLRRLLLGSTAESVARITPVPVLLVRCESDDMNSSSRAAYSRVLVPVDASEPSLAGLEQALSYARQTGALVKVVHVSNLLAKDGSAVPSVAYEPLLIEARKNANEVLAAARAVAHERGLVIDTELIEIAGGSLAQPILDAARFWKADLIVMGTHGYRGVRRLTMGSDAADILRVSPLPVLLTRQDGEFIPAVADVSNGPSVSPEI